MEKDLISFVKRPARRVAFLDALTRMFVMGAAGGAEEEDAGGDPKRPVKEKGEKK
jgi:hypothetical protein